MLKVARNERYLNTPKSEKVTFQPCAPFAKPLVEFVDTSSATTVTQHGKVMGFQQAYRKLACVSCYKAVVAVDDVLGNCEPCKMTQIVQNCSVMWTLRLLVQTKDNKKVCLKFQNQQVQQLLGVLAPTFKIGHTTAQNDLIVAILRADREILLTYDNMDYKVLSIEL